MIIKSSWISSHLRSNSRFDILSLRGFDILSLRSVYENHQSQSIKWANSLDQMTPVFSFKSQNRHPFILCIYIVSSSPCKYQLSFQFHINLTKAVFCHKKIAVFVLWLLYNLILIWISLIIIFYKQIVGDYF